MGRVSKEQMERNRGNIIKTSAELFRERGLDGVSVNDIMTAVGLTHGGFYGHFSSKDELEALACQRAFEDLHTSFATSGITSFEEFVEYYLSPGHRDNAGTGCAITALASDVLRKPPEKPVRDVYRDGVRKMASQLATIQGAEPGSVLSDQQLAQIAMLTGALILSRASAGDELSERFLDAAKKCLHEENDLTDK